MPGKHTTKQYTRPTKSNTEDNVIKPFQTVNKEPEKSLIGELESLLQAAKNGTIDSIAGVAFGSTNKKIITYYSNLDKNNIATLGAIELLKLDYIRGKEL